MEKQVTEENEAKVSGSRITGFFSLGSCLSYQKINVFSPSSSYNKNIDKTFQNYVLPFIHINISNPCHLIQVVHFILKREYKQTLEMHSCMPFSHGLAVLGDK